VSTSGQQKKYFLSAILICSLGWVLFVRVNLHHEGQRHNAYANYSSGDLVSWRQPSTLDLLTAPVISNQNWNFDFIAIEKILWTLKTDQAGDILISSDTTETLEQACNQTPKGLNARARERLQMLSRKGLAQSSGRTAAKLYEDYCQYQQEHNLSLTLLRNASGLEKRQLLRDAEATSLERQQRYFGDSIALELFRKKNNQTNYLNRRQLVNLNDDLTAAEKKLRLSHLQENYKASLSVE